jgi:hypothetical protein
MKTSDFVDSFYLTAAKAPDLSHSPFKLWRIIQPSSDLRGDFRHKVLFSPLQSSYYGNAPKINPAIKCHKSEIFLLTG